MKLRTTPSLLALAVSAAVLAPSAAFATNGYFAHGYSTKTNGLAGAGVAFPQDAMAAATNPAGMVMVGNRIDVGAAIFSPRRSYTAEGGPSGACGPTGCTFSVGPGSVDSGQEYFLIPHFGWNHMLSPDSSVGVSVYGNGGMNTDYKGGSATFGTPFGPMTFPGTFGDSGRAGVDLMQLFITPTYARKVAPNVALGISPIIAIQRFESTGLGAFGGDFNFDGTPGDAITDGVADNLTDNEHDTSYGGGVKLGILGEVAPGVSLGASVQSKMYMTEFDEYSDLFVDEGAFDIPATATVGIAWNVTPTSTLVFDIQRIWYSDIDAIANPFSNFTMGCFAGDKSQCLGGSDGVGFGWDDMTIYKLGYQWQTGGGWTWRVGASYGEQPIPETEVLFNILAPAVMETHLTFGFTKEMGKSNELSFAAMYAPETSVKGPNPLDPAQTIELEMHQYQVEASWAWKF